MRLFFAFLCMSVLTSGTERSTDDCACSGGVCKCNLRFAASVDSVCLVRSGINICLPVSDEPSFRIQQSSDPCVCSTNDCVCDFGTDVRGGEICFHSSGNVNCISSREVDDTNRSIITKDGPDGAVRGYDDDNCVCSSGVCKCDIWSWSLAQEICLVLSGRETCLPVIEDSSSQFNERIRGCHCFENNCDCRFETETEGGQVCFRSSGDFNCVRARQLHDNKAMVSYGKLTNDAVHYKYDDDDDDCTCSGGYCSCPWMKWTRVVSVCLVRSEGETCLPVTEESSSQTTYKTDSCIFSGPHYTCRFGTEAEGDEICFHSGVDTRCFPVRVDNDSNAPEGNQSLPNRGKQRGKQNDNILGGYPAKEGHQNDNA